MVSRRDPESTGRDIPGWLPWGVYALVTLFLFRKFVVSDAMLFGTDTLSLGYVARDFFDRALERGVFPLWNPLILGGTPFLESLAGGDSLYPPSLALLGVMETYRALGWKLVLHVFLAGGFTYGWLRILDRSRAASLLGGLAYLVAPFSVTLVYPGHDGKLFVTALTPLLFWVTEWAFRDGGLRRGLLRGLLPWVALAFAVGLVILTTHFQMAYFLFGAVGLYAIFRTVQIALGRGTTGEGGDRPDPPDPPDRPNHRPGWTPALSRFGLFLGASLLGASLAGVQLLPSVEYVLESSRRTATTVQADEVGSVAYSSSWSLHPEEIASLVVPEFVGSNVGGAEWTTDTYWGRNPFKLNHEYAGLVVLILAGMAFFGGAGTAPEGAGGRGGKGRRDLLWFMLGLGVLAILYALGSHTPVWRIFYEVVPGVSLFRAPSMAIFLYGLAVVTLAAFGIDRGLESARRAPSSWRAGGERFVWIAAALLGLLTILAASGVLSAAWTSLVYPDLVEAKARALGRALPYITRGLFVSALLVAGAGGLWWGFRSGRLGVRGLVAGLAFLLAVDGIRVDDPFIQTYDFHRWAAPTANMQFLRARQAEEPPFRVLSMVQGGQDVKPALYGLELAAGHHPNDLAAYRELIGMEGSGMPENLLQSSNVLQILNVRYLLWPDRELGPLEGMPRVSRTEGPTGQPFRSVYAVPGLPRARLVGRARVVPGSAAVDTILSSSFDPAAEVVLPEEPPLELTGAVVEGSVEWVERGVNRMVLRTRSSSPALLVVADNWYPGWAARVDGTDAPVLRANHTLRAVPLEAGEHRVEIFYDSRTLRRSAFLSLGTLLFLVLVGGASYARRRARSGTDRGA